MLQIFESLYGPPYDLLESVETSNFLET